MEIKYIKPIQDENVIERFANENGISFTQDFKEFFMVNNGGRPSLNTCLLENGDEKVVNAFLSFNECDKENIYNARRIIAEINEELIPFANDPGGNYYCLLESAVVFFSLEDEEVYAVADSFAMFLKGLK